MSLFIQAPHSLLMIRPSSFGRNEQTSSTNAFQDASAYNSKEVSRLAIEEFDQAVEVLKKAGVEVKVFDDTSTPHTPDALFPNNWFSTHHDGQLFTYPMEAENRRLERRVDVIDWLEAEFVVREKGDWSINESEGRFLEGTGSIVFDHQGEKAYACRSSRTDEKLLNEICNKLGYIAVVFDALDETGKAIYHTNVMMCVGSDIAIVCLDSIVEEDQERVIDSLQFDDKKVIAISYDQMASFAGNMLEVSNIHGESLLVMSKTAYDILVIGQLDAITKYVDVITVDIPTIERYGGGGIRCMLAGIHLPKK